MLVNSIKIHSLLDWLIASYITHTMPLYPNLLIVVRCDLALNVSLPKESNAEALLFVLSSVQFSHVLICTLY